MPAAKPSPATINNAVCAIVAAGLTPGALVIEADGAVRVDIRYIDEVRVPVSGAEQDAGGDSKDDAPLTWGDVA